MERTDAEPAARIRPAGRAPFGGETVPTILHRVINEPPVLACEPRKQEVRLRLWLNGEPAADVVDDDRPLPTGNAGLIVTQETGAALMNTEFDDFDFSEITS